MADDVLLNAGTGTEYSRAKDRGSLRKTSVVLLDVNTGGVETLLSTGQAAMAASLPVTIASDQSGVPTKPLAGGYVAGALTNAGDTLSLALPVGTSKVTLFLSPTALVTAGLVVQVSPDNGTTWFGNYPDSTQGNISFYGTQAISKEIVVGGVTNVRIYLATISANTLNAVLSTSNGPGGATFLAAPVVLGVGAAIVGKFGLDQTTSGSTNRAQLGPPSASSTVSVVNANPTSGTATAGSTVTLSNLGDASQLSIAVETAFIGTLQVQVGDATGSNWESNTLATGITRTATGAQSATITGPGIYEYNTGGAPNARVSCSAYTSGAPIVSISASTGVTLVQLDAPIPGTSAVNLSQLAGTTAVNGGVAGVFSVGGNVAHSAARTANPVTVGGVAITTLETTLVNGDVSYLFMSTAGQLVVKPYSTAESDWAYAAPSGGLATTTSTAMKAAAGANLRNYLTSISIVNASATVTNEVSILDGATVIARIYVGTGALLNSAVNMTFASPLKTSANAALNYQCSAAGQIYVNAQGYTSF